MGRNKELLAASYEEPSISVQKLNKLQAENMGLCGLIEDGFAQAVAIKRAKDGKIIDARVILGVDLKRFIYGDEEYFDRVLLEAVKALSSD